MRRLFTLSLVTVVIALLTALPLAYGRGQEKAAERTFDGQLAKVDTTAKTLTVKGTDNKEMTFSYTDQTQVTGGEKNVQGLSAKTGTQVKVNYHVEKGANIATRIEVAQK
jgi:hypothetical protein